MKKKTFLKKLKKEGKIQLVEPSKELEKAYTEKSGNSLESAKILLSHGKLEESVSLSYYSMYNMALALLFKSGIKSENHNASVIILKDVFGLDDEELKKAKKERIDKQYYTDFAVTKEQVDEMVKTAENFRSDIFGFKSRLTNKSIENFRNRFTDIFKEEKKKKW